MNQQTSEALLNNSLEYSNNDILVFHGHWLLFKSVTTDGACVGLENV